MWLLVLEKLNIFKMLDIEMKKKNPEPEFPRNWQFHSMWSPADFRVSILVHLVMCLWDLKRVILEIE